MYICLKFKEITNTTTTITDNNNIIKTIYYCSISTVEQFQDPQSHREFRQAVNALKI